MLDCQASIAIIQASLMNLVKFRGNIQWSGAIKSDLTAVCSGKHRICSFCLFLLLTFIPLHAADRAQVNTTVPVLGLTKKSIPPEVADELKHLDPRADGWVTEIVNDAAGIQFKTMNKAMHEGGETLTKHLADMVADDFTCDPLRPSPTPVSFTDGAVKVWRYKKTADGNLYKGASGLAQALNHLQSPLQNEKANTEAFPFDMHFKITRVQVESASSTTRVIVESHGHNPSLTLQQHATWECTWIPARKRGGLPQLLKISVIDYEEVTSPHRETPWFTDTTASVMGWTSESNDPLLVGIDDWRKQLDWRLTQDVTGPHGLSVGDVNGDGLEDLYVCETGGLPNRLLIQKEDGTIRDASENSGANFLEPSASSLLIDLDNDLDLDLVLATGRYVLFLANDGKGHFERRFEHTSDSVIRSLSAIDYNGDDRLDIYACGYYARSGDRLGLGRPVPYHDANNGVRNFLLQNNDWSFKDVTAETGLDANNRRFTYAAAWEDFDNDGDPDLYVANDFGRNNLFRNDSGFFTDVAAEAGVEDLSAGMSVSWGDYNRDGWMDLYVGNMFSSAGNRIAFQRKYRPGEDSTPFQRHARGNSLFLNQGDGTFLDTSEEANVTLGRWAWCSSFADVNNDGWEDILVVNGMVTGTDDTGDL